MMTLEEYTKRKEQEDDWAPGWEAIDSVFEKLYPNQEPHHYGTLITSRAGLGGDEYLDGFSYYDNPKGYSHLVTYGMSELYYDEECFGGEFSRWGYEMTMKLKENHEESQWAITLLSHLAQYTYENEKFFMPFQYIGMDIRELANKPDSKMSAMFIVPDTEAQTIQSVHGEVMFLQLILITDAELQALINKEVDAEEFYQKLKAADPDLLIDFDRVK